MTERKFSESAEELLEFLYVRTIEEDATSIPLEGVAAQTLAELHESGAVLIESNRIALSGFGLDAGRSVVRRHRLAERLLTDVLGSAESSMHDQACKFEHVLSDGLEEQICTLLGHPRVCPHGRPIPDGECCRKKRSTADQVIVPVSMMNKGESGTIVYINPADTEILDKLMAMGVLPGSSIELIASYPSFVFQAGQSQFAVDRDIAETVFIRRTRSSK